MTNTFKRPSHTSTGIRVGTLKLKSLERHWLTKMEGTDEDIIDGIIRDVDTDKVSKI